MKKKFILFSDCIPVKGANRSTICDTKNNNYFLIPNGLYEILVKYNGRSIEQVKQEIGHEYNDIIDEYFEFLLSNNLIFFSSNPEYFPKITLKWDSPSPITNMIIDYDYTNHDFNNIVRQLETLKCSYIQLRFFNIVDFAFLKNLIGIIKKEKSRIISVDFVLPFDESISEHELKKILKKNSRIHSIVIYNSPQDYSHKPIREKMGYLMYVQRNILSEKHCGIINTEYFYSNIKLFSESQNHNTCLNRKISIDKNGDIKNCPSMTQSFGNIQKTSLLDALSHPDFKRFWNITKEEIEICRDCEFRHICTDCRAYIENPSDVYSKPLKCGYNPYTCQWDNWSSNPLKQRGIEFYGMQEFVTINE